MPTDLSPVVCALDLASESEPALVAAVELAARTERPLHVVTVRPAERPGAERQPAETEPVVAALVEVFVDRALGAGACAEIAPVIAVARQDDPATGVVAYAREVAAGSLVLGTHGRRGLRRFRMGSVAEDIVRRATCPVFVVPNQSAARTPGPAHPVLYATDFSPASERALPAARALAALYGAPLEAVSVLDELAEVSVGSAADGGGRRGAAAPFSEADLRAFAGEAELAATHLVHGDPADAIVRLADERDAGAVVMGTHGRSGVSHALFGSVTAAALRRLRCPLLAVHA